MRSWENMETARSRFWQPELTAFCRVAEQPRQRRREGRLVVARGDKIAVGFAQHAFDVADIDRGDGAAGSHRLEQGVWHLLGIRRQGKDVEAAEHRFGSDLPGKRHPLGHPEFTGEPGQRRPLDPVAGDHQTGAKRGIESREDPQQTPDILFRAQRRHGADYRVARLTGKAGYGVAHRIGKALDIDAVRDIGDFFRRQFPHPARHFLEPVRGDHDLDAARQRPAAEQHPAADLPIGLLLAKAGLEMQLAGDRPQAVGHRPFDRTPIIGDQQIGPQPPQRGSILEEAAHQPVPAPPGR